MNKFQQRLENVEELRGHIIRLAPKNSDGELTGAYKKCIEEMDKDTKKAKKWLDSQPDFSQYINT